MPKCECKNICKGNAEAVEIVWCPTWINKDGYTLPKANKDWKFFKHSENEVSDHPPMWVCAECLKLFKIETNPNATGTFYFGTEAEKQFNLQNKK